MTYKTTPVILKLVIVLISFVFTSSSDAENFQHVRVILCIDASGSMCIHYGAENCCVPGDSSGFCTKNDPENNRIKGAHTFVDSLRSCDPESQVGVITFAAHISEQLAPLALNSDDNINRIHTAIDRAACETEYLIDKVDDASVPSGQTLSKKSAINVTNIGDAFTEAIEIVDTDYDVSPASFSRHVILLTDGAWDDFQENSPQQVIEAYQSAYPSRQFPTVHSIFIYDSLTHVQHGYPPLGCASESIIDLTPLQTLADFSGGMYFLGSTPEKIVEAFNLDLCEPASELRQPRDKNSTAMPFRNIIRNSAHPLYDLRGRSVPLSLGSISTSSPVQNGVFVYRNNNTEQTILMFRNR